MTTEVESSAKPDRSTLNELYDEKSKRGVTAIDRMDLQIHHASLVGLKAANEDRIAVQKCDLGVLIAVFDGHYTDELSDYAAKVLPQQLCERIARNISNDDDLPAAVEEALSKGIREFDASLIDEVYNLFPEGAQTDWDDGFWDEPYWIFDALGGRSKESEKFRTARRAVVGTTALVAFIDQAKENVWVASLGDSEAVLGRVLDGTVSCTALNELHNVKNPEEVARLQTEHPGEPPVIYDGRTMRQLGLTRALGDYQMKTDFKFAFKFLGYVYPSPIIGQQFEFWRERGLEHYHPPYISNVPAVQHYALLPGDRLVLASDGLRSALTSRGVEGDNVPASIISLAIPDVHDDAASLQTLSDRLGHDFLPFEARENLADFVVRNALFGTSEGKMAEELALVDDNADHRYRDDISVVVVAFGGSRPSDRAGDSAQETPLVPTILQPSSAPSLADLEATYAAMCTRGTTTIETMSLEIHHSSLRGVKAASEDRISTCECEFGVLIAIFDGHYTDELSSYAAKVLPQQLCDRISRNISPGDGADISTAVEEALVKGVEDFDASLLDDVLKHFPQGADTDWDDPLWDDPAEVFEIIGYSRDDPVFVAARRTIVGATALVGFIDKQKRNLWVASLGDSEAVLGRVVDGHLRCEVLNDLHNVDNPDEVARLHAEHPNEPPVVYGGRTLGRLAITRALGDFQMKVGLRLATRVLSYAYPSYLGTNNIEDWQRRGHLHPPYISSTPSIRRHALLPGVLLVLASDGLRLALEAVPTEDARTQSIIALAGPELSKAAPVLMRLGTHLGHDFIDPSGDDPNIADRLIKNALFGVDAGKMAAELALTSGDTTRYRDDISVVALRVM